MNYPPDILDRYEKKIKMKLGKIEKSLKKVGDKYYRKESFVYVLNTGLNQEISVSLSFQDIRQLLITLYNAA